MATTLPRTPEQSLSDELRELIHRRNMLTERTKTRVIYELQKDKIETEERRLHFQKQTLKEIISSEERYLSQLKTILKYFRIPLENVIRHTAAADLFDNIEILLKLNCELLENLTMSKTAENIASTFLKVAPFLKLYITYTNDYKKVIFAIQELRRQDQRLDDSITMQETRPEVGMRLNSLLIVPIQRVPRYILLLKELIEYSSTDAPEYGKIQGALHEIEEVTEFINNQVHQHDNLLRLMQIQLSLSGGKPNIILPGRKLIKEGILMKASHKGGGKAKPRHFVLMTDSLLCCKIRSGSLYCRCLMPLRKIVVEHVLGRGVFNLMSPGHDFLLYSEDNNTAAEWVEAISHAKLQYEERRRTLQKKVSSRQALRINQCITLDDSFDANETVYKKRKRTDEENQYQCFSSIKKRFLIPSGSSSSTALVKYNHKDENEGFSGVLSSLSKMILKLKSYWF